MESTVDHWRAQAWEAERPLLTSLALSALDAAPSAERLRDLATGACALQELAAEQQQRAMEHVRWGLKSKDENTTWDAVHVAGELGLEELAKDMLTVLDSPKRYAPPVRARAAEAYAELADKETATAKLDTVKNDDEAWTVRRLAGDAVRLLGQGRSLRGDLFGRLQALIRCGRMRFEADDVALDANELGKLGLRLPAAYFVFLQEVFPGGRLVVIEGAGRKTKEKDGEAFFLKPAQKIGATGGTLPADLKNMNEYVWARYVEGSRNYAKVDEDYALKRYGEYYGRRGRVDADAYNYGILLFESAFRDDANRTAHLLRCREILRAYKRMTAGEEWDVVDDRLAEAEDTVRDEGLTWPASPAKHPSVVGSWTTVAELQLDLELPGMFAHDPEGEVATHWQVAPSIAAFLNNPTIDIPGEAAEDPLQLMAEVEGHIDAGRKRQAARQFCEVLEHYDAAAVLERAAKILTRDGMSRLDAAQLLSTIPLAGDRKSMELVRAVFQELDPEVGAELIEAAGPFNEDGSQIAELINAASGIRKRTHSAVKKVAKDLREARASSHIRTLKNPWYKKR